MNLPYVLHEITAARLRVSHMITYCVRFLTPNSSLTAKPVILMVPTQCPDSGIGSPTDHVHRQGTDCCPVHVGPELDTAAGSGWELLTCNAGNVAFHSRCAGFNE